MGGIYKGFAWTRTYVGRCENGIIYCGQTQIGRYEDGDLYNHYGIHVGSYADGRIYNQFGLLVGSYEFGIVYINYLQSFMQYSGNRSAGNRQDSTPFRLQVGTYESDPVEAAALVLLFL